MALLMPGACLHAAMSLRVLENGNKDEGEKEREEKKMH